MKKVSVAIFHSLPAAALLVCLAGLSPAALAQATPAAEPVFDVYEYVIEGNTLLANALVERTVGPYMGPGRRFTDIEQARSALEKAYQDAGYLSVLVSLPNQQVDRGEVRLEVVETPLSKVTVTGAQHHLPSRIKDAVPSLKEGTVPHFPTLQKQLAELQSGQLQVTPLVNANESGQAIDVDLKVEDKPPTLAAFSSATPRATTPPGGGCPPVRASTTCSSAATPWA